MAGTTVIVTGGSAGIGLATAKAYASRGADVAIIARDESRLAAARAGIEAARKDSAQRVLAVSADVTDFEAVREAIDRIVGQLGAPHVFVNSAGIIIPGYFESMPLEAFRASVDLDILGTVYPTRAVVPYMIEAGCGHIVNVSSVAGFVGVFGYTAYSTAKFAIMGFSESLRYEMKPHGISVHVVCPPDTDTPGLAYEKSLRPHETEVCCGNIKAVDPGFVADALVRGVDLGRYSIVPGFVSALYYRLKGLAPSLFFMVMDGDVRKARAAIAARRVEVEEGA